MPYNGINSILRKSFGRAYGTVEENMSRSGIRMFQRNGISVRGKLLPFEEFRFYRDSDFTKMDEAKAQGVMEKAEQFLTEELTVMPLSLYREKYLKGIRTGYEGPHHHRREMLFYLLLAELHENQGRFVEKIADVLWAIMEETTWVIPAHQSHSLIAPGTDVPEVYREEDIPGLDLYAANCSAVVGLVVYYLRDKLDAISPIICKRAEHLVYLRGIRPFVMATFSWATAAHNWVTGITCNILTACAATVRDMKLRERTVERAMTFLDNYTAGMPEDGTCDEGPGYWGAGAGCLFECTLLIDDMTGGKVQCYNDPMLLNLCTFVTKMNIHNTYYVNFEDCQPTILHDGVILSKMGEKLNSPELLAFGHKMASLRKVQSFFFGMPYRMIRCAYTESVTEEVKTKATKSVWMDGHKIAVFRESEDTSSGLFLATKGGTNSEPGNHNDLGCLVVFSCGKPVIIDPGIGTYNNDYFGKSRYLRWFTNASYHSCPTVDGIDQGGGSATNFHTKDEVCDVENRCVSMDLSPAYPAEAGILKLVRTSRLEEGKITISDEFVLDREREIALHFTCVREPKLLECGKIELPEGRVLSYDGKIFTPEIEKVVNKNLPYDDLNFSKWGVDCMWRINLVTNAKQIVSIVTIT